MRKVRTAGVAVMAVAVALLGQMWPVAAQQLSERSVRTLMGYAWYMTPEQFTKPNGQKIEVDKKKRREVEVPLETAREVIQVGRLSAHAWTCDLVVDQMNNHRTLMYREHLKKRWSEQQMLYMNQLHLVTVMVMTGKLGLVERGKENQPQVMEKKAEKKTCSEEQKAKVRNAVRTYMRSGPQLPRRPSAPAGGPVPATPSSHTK